MRARVERHILNPPENVVSPSHLRYESGLDAPAAVAGTMAFDSDMAADAISVLRADWGPRWHGLWESPLGPTSCGCAKSGVGRGEATEARWGGQGRAEASEVQVPSDNYTQREETNLVLGSFDMETQMTHKASFRVLLCLIAA